MKTSVLFPWAILVVLAFLGGNPGWAANEDHLTNNPELTGEPVGEAKLKSTPAATNAAPELSPKPSTNSPASTVAKPSTPALPPPETANRVATLAVADLREYEMQPPAVQRLLASALALTTRNLSYKYGSSDPQDGGMDCSGTVYYLLNAAGLGDVPRDSSGMYKWVWNRSQFQAVTSPNADSFEFSRLKPGDLLFWTGTYNVDRDPPVTHVMIYLGINRHSGRRVMVGASEGRQFDGISRYGVSVFDFTMPGKKRKADPGAATSPTDSQARFIGYGSVPGLNEQPVGKSP